MQIHLKACGWVCRPTDSWGDADLDVLGPGPYVLQICTAYEEDLPRAQHYVRYRVTAAPKLHLPIMVVLLTMVLGLLVMSPHLLPLGLLVLIALRGLLRAKKFMTTAVSQLAIECGEAVGMVRVEDAQ